MKAMTQSKSSTFDTLYFSKKLEKSGLKREISEQIVEVIKESRESYIENLASKDDIKNSKNELRIEIQEVKSELKIEIQEVKNELRSEIQEVRNELRSEIQEVRNELKIEIQEVKSELKIEIQEVKSDITLLRKDMESIRKDIIIKLGGLMVVGISILAALIKI